LGRSAKASLLRCLERLLTVRCGPAAQGEVGSVANWTTDPPASRYPLSNLKLI
jgi:hypothetical protein